jgi:membrane-bound lytic murein transglycosylase D
MKHTILYILLLFIFIGSTAKAQNGMGHEKKDSSFLKPNMNVQDNPIAAMLDSLSNLQIFGKANNLYDLNYSNTHNFANDFVPSYSDSVYTDRISQLAKTSPIPLIFNSRVKDMIDLYAVRKRALTERVLGFAQLYFPMIEELLDRYGIPLEMKYLAIVESALNPIARSPVGAGGLWQFMNATGKQYKLNVSTLVDERSDPYKSTVAACKYLNSLYKVHKNWLLVMAAYNCGSGNVNKAIVRSGGKTDFWQICQFLPRETSDYVPAFIAVTYVMNHASDHNLVPIMPVYKFHEIDTVEVKDYLTFDVLSERLNVSKDELLFLNPEFRKGVIPATNDKSYFISIPRRCIPDFVNNEASFYAYSERKGKMNIERLLAKNGKESNVSGKGNLYHKVKTGESLAVLSKKYNTTIAQLKEWNNLNKRGTISRGQQLIVNKSAATYNETLLASNQISGKKHSGDQSPTKSYEDNSSDSKNQQGDVQYLTYKVQPGDTLLDIANKNETSINKIKQWNKLKGEEVVPGQEIKIKVKS